MAEPTLYQKLGGRAAIDLAVDMFYERVVADPALSPFFVGIDMARMRDHQRKFLMLAFGGGPGYDGRGLRDAHSGLVSRPGLSDTHFDAVVAHLAEVLRQLGVDAVVIAEVLAVTESVRKEVLGR